MSYRNLIKDVSGIVDDALSNKQADSNLITTRSYWEIGKRLFQDEQQGQIRAGYGMDLMRQLAEELKKRYGRGYGLANLKYMRQFHRSYNKTELKAKLNWSHYRLLVQVQDKSKRSKLEKQVIAASLSKRQLAEQVKLVLGREDHRELAGLLKRPTGRTGLLQLRYIEENGKKLAFLDLGFNIWLEAHADEIKGLEQKQLLEITKKAMAARASKFDGKRSDLYVYRASLDHVADGDTFVVYIECGLGVRTRQILRLRSVNAPALTELAGIKAREALESLLTGADQLIIKTSSRDKYGRYVADVLLGGKNQSNADILESGVYVNQELLDQGLVERAG